MTTADGADRTTPVFLVVDDDPDTVEALRLALDRRFGADYTVLGYRSAHDGLAVLKRLHDCGQPVAVLIADLWMPDMTGLEFLVQAHRLHPAAGRAAAAGLRSPRNRASRPGDGARCAGLVGVQALGPGRRAPAPARV